MRIVIRRAAAALMLIALAACGDESSKIAADHELEARNSQAYARALFDGLCARRDLSEPRCACLRTRILDLGARSVAFIGASYGGNLEAAAEASAELDETARAAAIDAYFAADAVCEAEEGRAGPGGAPQDATAAADVTLADVRASCRPGTEDLCVCRAEALAQAVGDGGLAAAVAINRQDEAALQSLGQGREAGWAEAVLAAYSRTAAPCIVQATR